MDVLFFSCKNPEGEYQEINLGGPDLETDFELLTNLTAMGHQLIKVCLFNGGQHVIQLPVEVFDGAPMRQPILKLQKEWEAIVYQG